MTKGNIMKTFTRRIPLYLLFASPIAVFAQQNSVSPQLLQKGLEDRYIFWLSLVAIAGFVVVLCTALLVLRNHENVITSLFKHDFTILRVLTVLFIIWAAGVLTAMGVFNQGVSTLFGAIVGYVFGSIRSNREDRPA